MSVRNRPGLNEMRDVITAEADRLYGIARARQKSGEKIGPEIVRKVEVLDAAGDLIARLIPVHVEVSKVVKGVTIARYERDWGQA